VLQCVVDLGIEDYNLVVTGNKKLPSEQDKLKHHCDGLEAELSEACSDVQKRIDDLEARVRSSEARSIDVAAASEKRLRDFEDDLVQKLEKLRGLYAGNVQTIGGLYSSALAEEPSTGYYLRWLSEEISGPLDMCSGVNEFFFYCCN
jgi:hypothetical protein